VGVCPQHGRDDRKRRLCTEQPDGQGVAQRVRALALRRLELDPGQVSPIRDDAVEPVALADGFERRGQVGEEMPVLYSLDPNPELRT
jgi:hypothetical protein